MHAKRSETRSRRSGRQETTTRRQGEPRSTARYPNLKRPHRADQQFRAASANPASNKAGDCLAGPLPTLPLPVSRDPQARRRGARHAMYPDVGAPQRRVAAAPRRNRHPIHPNHSSPPGRKPASLLPAPPQRLPLRLCERFFPNFSLEIEPRPVIGSMLMRTCRLLAVSSRLSARGSSIMRPTSQLTTTAHCLPPTAVPPFCPLTVTKVRCQNG